jgi:hypothetical protein
MKKTYVYLFMLLSFALLNTGCSDVGFDALPKLSCDDVGRDQDTDCFTDPNNITVSFTFGIGDVDILFVNDNSGSMYVEQAKMANAFPNFLTNISNLFYRIAIITTDVSASIVNGVPNTTPRAANGMGAFQDGKLLEFKTEAGVASGLFAIDYNTPNVTTLFRGTIKRNETLVCDSNNYRADFCPSSDERGIYAANLAIDRGDKKCIREGAHLALVILSDEDERSAGGMPGYPILESKDLPESLVLNIAQKYPTKSFSVHSIVTNNETCKQQQTQTTTNTMFPLLGFIGYQYMKLSSPSSSMLALGNLVAGNTGTICTSDFGAQMGDIGSKIRDRTFDAPKKLACMPDEETISIVTNPVGYENQIDFTIDSQRKVRFSNLPIGVKVTFTYTCPRY